jgi:hypothetical protein
MTSNQRDEIVSESRMIRISQRFGVEIAEGRQKYLRTDMEAAVACRLPQRLGRNFTQNERYF